MRKSERNKEIIDACRSGDFDPLLEHLYAKTYYKIRNYVLNNSGDESDAKDLFQEAVLVLYDKVQKSTFETNKSVDGFVYTIARNKWIDQLRRRKKSVSFDDFYTEDKEGSTNSLLAILNSEMIIVFREVLNKLGDPCKELIQLSVYDSKSMKEISVIMNYTSINVTKTYLYRCKKRLVKLIESNERYMEVLKP